MHDASHDPDRFITTSEFCRLVGNIKVQTARLWRLRGTGPRYVRLGSPPFGRVVYRWADVQEWLEARSATSTSEEYVKAARARAAEGGAR